MHSTIVQQAPLEKINQSIFSKHVTQQAFRRRKVELQGKSKRSTNDIGAISESAIITRFLQLGYEVLIPHNKKLRYDLIIEDADEQFWRIQCKTARIRFNGTVILFDTANHNYALKTKRLRHYRGECDFLPCIAKNSTKPIFFQWVKLV
jgi:hypothetical protein